MNSVKEVTKEINFHCFKAYQRESIFNSKFDLKFTRETLQRVFKSKKDCCLLGDKIGITVCIRDLDLSLMKEMR